jgi:hypothetical protein
VAEKNRTKGASPTAVFRSPSRLPAAQGVPVIFLINTISIYTIIIFIKTPMMFLYHFLTV